jgi:16S rRNA (adenine1518-N6/adenine1519-N6)-dimethyltransferase
LTVNESFESVSPIKALGQHFLVDGNIRRKILDAAQIQPGERIVEIGPGTGSLTTGLLDRGASVIAIEIDRRLVEGLKRVPHPHLTLVCADALRYPYQELPTPYKVVANLPYGISTPLLFRLIEAAQWEGLASPPQTARIKSMVLMLQKEVALRLGASAGDEHYGALSVIAQFYAEVQVLFSVTRNCFRPRPKVDSAVVALHPLPQARLPVRHPEPFLRLVKGAFAHRRKQMLNSLADAGFERPVVEVAMQKMGLSPTVRGEALSLHQFVALSEMLETDAFLTLQR